MSDTVLLVGYGQMGAVIADHLAKKRTIVVYDRNSERMRQASKRFAVVDSSDCNSSIVVLALPGPSEVKEEIPHFAKPGTLVIDTTSIDPKTAIKAEQVLVSAGGQYVEAPVLGGPPQAGKWVFLVGGETSALANVTAMFASLGRVVHFGPVGSGSRAKLLNNILTGVNAAAVAEVLALAERLGVDLDRLYDAIANSGSAGRNAVWQVRVPKILAGTLLDTFSMDLMLKDLVLAQVMAEEAGLAVPVASAAIRHFTEAAETGWGRRDIGYLAEVIHQIHNARG